MSLPAIPKNYFEPLTELADNPKQGSAVTRWKRLEKMPAPARYALIGYWLKTAPEIVAVDPAYWTQASKRMEKYERTCAKEIAALKAKRDKSDKARLDRQNFIIKAKNGGGMQPIVVDYLKACHAGNISYPDDDTPPGYGLLEMVYASVYFNKPEILEQIAYAITHVHKRTEGEGETFKVNPANPVDAELIKMVGCTVPTKTREITETARGLGEPIDENGNVKGYSERSARRLRHTLGLQSLPRGRPRNNPEIIRPTIP